MSSLLNAPITPVLFRLTLPMVFGILAIFLFNLADTYFIGLLGTHELAAVSFTFPIAMLISNLAIGQGIAVSALVARSIGKGDQSVAASQVTYSLYLSVLISGLITVVGLMLKEKIFIWMGADKILLPLINEYMTWYFFSAISLMLVIVGNSALRATGNTKVSSQLMVGSALLNIVLDPIFIFGWGPIPALGMKGAVIASMICWTLVLLVMGWILVNEKLLAALPLNASTWATWRKNLQLGLPAMLTNMLGPLINMALFTLVATFGIEAVAAYGVGSRIEPIAMIVILALTASLPPFVGQNQGAGNNERIMQGLKLAIKFLLVWQLVVFVILFISADYLAPLFSDSSEVQYWISRYIYILPITYGCLGIVFVTTSTLNALHKPNLSLCISILRLLVFALPMAWIGSLIAGFDGLLIGSATANILMGLWILRRVYRADKTNWLARKATIED
jgi:putative MATE family efflux protein